MNDFKNVNANIPEKDFSPAAGAFLDRADEDHAVIRFFEDSGERARIILGSNKAETYILQDGGRWEVLEAANTWDGGPEAEFFKIESADVLDGTLLDFVAEFMNDERLPGATKANILLLAFSSQTFEQACRSVLLPFCRRYVQNYRGRISTGTWNEFLTSFAGSMNTNGRSLYSKLRASKYQLGRIMEMYQSHCAVICQPYHLKKMFAIDDLAPLPKDTFDTVLDYLVRRAKYPEAKDVRDDLLPLITEQNGVNGLLKYINGPGRLFGMSFSFRNRTIDSVEQMLMDNYRMNTRLPAELRIAVRLSSVEEIFFDHERLVNLINQSRELFNQALERRIAEEHISWDKQIQARRELWSVYSYEEPEGLYMVVSPQSAGDIEAEGRALRHCVASYIPNVAAGKSIIMFLRRTSAPSKPFYTIEINPDGIAVRQIHGLHNCNIGSKPKTEPGLAEFVNRWAKHVLVRAKNYNGVLAPAI